MRRVVPTIVFTLTAATAIGQEAAGRFSFMPVDAGILRLDTQSGEVSICSEKDGMVSCAPVADEARASDAPAVIADRLDALEERITALEERSSFLPDSEAIDRVGVLAERMMVHLFEMVGEMRRELEGETR